jgi:hypothetical protein
MFIECPSTKLYDFCFDRKFNMAARTNNVLRLAKFKKKLNSQKPVDRLDCDIVGMFIRLSCTDLQFHVTIVKLR